MLTIDPVNLVLSRLQKVKRGGRGWTARCPAHEDRNNSLSVSQGEDRRALLKCFAGCSTESIVQAMGLEMKQLFEGHSQARGGRGEGGAPPTPKTRATRQHGQHDGSSSQHGVAPTPATRRATGQHEERAAGGAGDRGQGAGTDSRPGSGPPTAASTVPQGEPEQPEPAGQVVPGTPGQATEIMDPASPAPAPLPPAPLPPAPFVPTPYVPAPSPGCTLAAYAEHKRLPADFLRGLGIGEVTYEGAPALRIPYMDEGGEVRSIRFRTALLKGADSDNRFRWKVGSKPGLYGLWRLHEARDAGRVALVEGESDCHTLWLHGVPALGIPGAGNWREEWAAHLEGIERIDVVIEPDRAARRCSKS